MQVDDKLIRDLTPELEKTSVKWYITFFFFFAVFAVGIYGLIQQIDKGHVVTGMRDNVVC